MTDGAASGYAMRLLRRLWPDWRLPAGHAPAGPGRGGRRPLAVARLAVEPSRASREAWDSFAQSCDASFWCSWGGARMWQLKLHTCFRLKRFELWLDMPTGERSKVGQCALGIGPQLRVFSDGLVLRPEHADLWTPAMEALLGRLGPGRYVYGSFWSLEAPREGNISSLPRTRVVARRPLVVEAIDLRRFPLWDDFLRTVSRNVVRNAKKASTRHGRIDFSAWRGLGMFRVLPEALRLRSRMYSRKSIAFSRTRGLINQTLRCLMLSAYVSVAVASAGRQNLATAGRVSFGRNVYYIDGASDAGLPGAGWNLMLHLFEEAHRSGQARFLLGYTDLAVEPMDAEWVSPVRYRRDCRAQGLETSIVAFDFGRRYRAEKPVPGLLLERTGLGRSEAEEDPSSDGPIGTGRMRGLS